MRLALTTLAAAAGLVLGASAQAQTAQAQNAETKAAPRAFPTATGFPVSVDPGHDRDLTVSRGASSIFSSRGAAIGGEVDWTGFYIGGEIGGVSGDSDASSSDESAIAGVTLGYDYDFGRWVLGGALDYDFADFDIAPNSQVEQIFRLKIRGGPKFRRGLLYAAGGYANADSDNLGNEDGWFVGGGYDYMVNDQFSIGGEVLYHEFDGFGGTGNDVEATSVQVRAAFRF